ncbi:MAG TPA: undecaprenyl-diphosphate phosphatase [Smithellaceae bacterium]|nr:undecaprenyl-diphosphate phosphatase [Smithellaceae bacterium]HQF83471.1 undecaprenyl-diphosphate phosphatase [Smithellaceae bacterium]HQG79660.1 undecaprenyl-diphosphate phosphatase [Smithellaceae bacterium]
MDIVQAVILSIVEGATEFLPVSSTGHMILASYMMKIHDQAFVKTFTIAIQLGAIAAIVMLYYRRFLQGRQIYIKLGIAFIPTAIVGFLAYKTIKTYLFNPLGVSLALVAGGIVLIAIDKLVVARESRYAAPEDISYKNAFFIGLIQCLSMIPGVSRAAATIIGGVFNGLDKKQATEFSFLLAVPTMLAATGYDLLKTDAVVGSAEIMLLACGFIGAFLSAWVAVMLFVRFVQNHGFKVFGYYRIVIGIVFLLYLTMSGPASLLKNL